MNFNEAVEYLHVAGRLIGKRIALGDKISKDVMRAYMAWYIDKLNPRKMLAVSKATQTYIQRELAISEQNTLTTLYGKDAPDEYEQPRIVVPPPRSRIVSGSVSTALMQARRNGSHS
jgi:hypothetical protein